MGPRRLSPSGIRRRLPFGAVWHHAPFGISRLLAFRALWHFAPFGISRLLSLLRPFVLLGGRRQHHTNLVL
jgi:hypothetical protein